MNYRFVVAAAALLATAPAHTAVLLTDDFEAETPATPQTTLTNFDVTAGTIDIVQSPDFGIICASGAGRCLDLDGSPGVGTILTKNSWSFGAGDVFTLTFDASGSQRSGPDAFSAGFLVNGGTEVDFVGPSLASTDPFQTFSYTYTATGAGTLKAYVRGLGTTDNVGVVIDNLSLSAVPEPSSWAMLIAGLGLIGFNMRRRRSVQTSFA